MTKFEQALAKLASLPLERQDSAKVEQALTKLAELPPEDQETIAEMILDYGSADDAYALSDEQVAEIERRLADENAETMSLEEFLEETERLLK